MKIKGIAIVPGSFDPITNGHLDIIKKAAEMYDKVYVAVMINEAKTYMFSLEERKEIAEAAVLGIEETQVIASDGMLWKLAQELDAVAIVKGYRNQKDFEYEQKMAEFNKSFNPKAKTVLLKADENMLDISSTLVRKHINANSDFRKYIPTKAFDVIVKILSKRG